MYELFLILFFVVPFMIDKFRFILFFNFMVFSIVWILYDNGTFGVETITLQVITIICVVLITICVVVDRNLEIKGD